MSQNPFFIVHRDLDREGPGDASDVHWALNLLDIAGPVRVLDAGCGPGADTETLAASLPEAQILAVDGQDHFIQAAAARCARF